MFDHSRLAAKKILLKQNNPVAHHHNFIRKIHSLSNHSMREIMDNWTAPKYTFMEDTIVLGDSQVTRCIPLSKREAKIKNQAGFFVFDKFTLQVKLGDKSGGVYASL